MGVLTTEHQLPKDAEGPWRVISKAEHAALPLGPVGVPRLWLSHPGHCIRSHNVTPPNHWRRDSEDVYVSDTRPGWFLPKHNPAGVDPTKAETDGYRLVTKAEDGQRRGIFVPGAQWYDEYVRAWRDRQWVGGSGASITPADTVRVPHPHGADLSKPAEVPGHNPDGLTAAQVGVAYGYRLLTLKEVAARRSIEVGDAQVEIWSPSGQEWLSYGAGNDTRFSYRVPDAAAGYSAPVRAPKTPDRPVLTAEDRLRRVVRVLDDLDLSAPDGLSLGRVSDALTKIAQAVKFSARFNLKLTSI